MYKSQNLLEAIASHRIIYKLISSIEALLPIHSFAGKIIIPTKNQYGYKAFHFFYRYFRICVVYEGSVFTSFLNEKYYNFFVDDHLTKSIGDLFENCV